MIQYIIFSVCVNFLVRFSQRRPISQIVFCENFRLTFYKFMIVFAITYLYFMLANAERILNCIISCVDIHSFTF